MEKKLNPEQDRAPVMEHKMVRRGLLGALSALGAAGLMHLKAGSALAADLVLGAVNVGTATTTLNSSAPGSPTYTVLEVENLRNGGDGVSAKGGPGALGTAGGSGLRAVGGNNPNGSGGVQSNGGDGLISFGGNTTGGLGTGGRGVRGLGGDASGSSVGGVGVQGTGGGGPQPGDGVLGFGGGSIGSQGNGVRGETTSSTKVGVAGSNLGSGHGVEGRSDVAPGFGVRGFSRANGTGVKGVSNTPNSGFSTDGNGSGIGVHGKSNSGAGVRGDSVSGPGVLGQSGSQPGVDGISTSSLGVRGTSTEFVGVVGVSTGSHGLYGSSGSASGAGLVGENTGGGLAGVFSGDVQVFGGLQVFGAKNAVIKMQDGTNAAVYCQEAPEPYFEDFGEARLVNGVAQVALEPEFATLVSGGKYMVFLTSEGDTRGLFVARKSPTSFEVREVQGGTANVPFTYRVVTKRKDIDGKRFARVSEDAKHSMAAARAQIANTPKGRKEP